MSQLQQQVLKQTADEFEIYPAVPEDQVYSPHRRYVAGQRLFHAGLTFSSFFVVEEPVRDSSFTARFDDGKTMRLPHNDQGDEVYPFTLEGKKRALEELVMEGLEGVSDIVEIEGLYTLRGRLDQIPFDRLSEPRALRKLSHLEDTQRPEDRIDELRGCCRRYGLGALYYLTLLRNLGSVLSRGILARNLAPLDHASFADPDIQSKRHWIRPREDLALTLHDCVPLFFAPKPPLLYKEKERQAELAYIRVDPIVLLEPGVAFSAKNAVSPGPFFTDIADLDKLNWEILNANYWGSDDDEQHSENKLYRQAEVQVPVTVPVSKFLDVRVHDQHTLHRAHSIISEAHVTIRVVCDKRLYC